MTIITIGAVSFFMICIAVGYIGYVIGIVHASIVAQKELRKRDDLIKIYQDISTQLSAMFGRYLDTKNELQPKIQSDEVEE